MINTDLLDAYVKQHNESKLPTVTLRHGSESVTVSVNPIFEALIPVLPIVSKLFATDAEPGDTVNTRDLHAALGIGRDYSTWITSTIKSMNLIEGVHYVMVMTDPSKKENWPDLMKAGGRARKDYYLLLNTAQHIAARLDNEKGYQVREYLFAVTKAFQKTIEQQFKKQLDDANKLVAHQRALVDRNEALTLQAVKKLGAPSISAFEQASVKDGLLQRARYEAAQHAAAALLFWEMTSKARRSSDPREDLDYLHEKYGNYSDLSRDSPPWMAE
jgi:phage anti-repressor protein